MLIEDAKAVNKTVAFSVVLEGVPRNLGRKITEMLSIPTIGIGAGPDCDGQVLVIHDLLGLATGLQAEICQGVRKPGPGPIEKGVKEYIDEVK